MESNFDRFLSNLKFMKYIEIILHFWWHFQETASMDFNFSLVFEIA